MFECTLCFYKTVKQSNYIRHCNTAKHITKEAKYDESLTYKFKYKCSFCNKYYVHRSGLSYHIKKCHNDEYLEDSSDIIMNTRNESSTLEIVQNQNNDIKDMFMTLMNENKELQDKLLQLASTPKIVNNNSTYNIINYLNTECKDAFNLSDFINQIDITFDDIKNIKEEGYVSNIKNTLIRSLNSVDIHKRPIHCTDRKRKQFYVKERNEWSKDHLLEKTRKGIDIMNNKQLFVLETWKNNNPGWMKQDISFDKVCDIQRTLLSMYSSKEKKDKVMNKIITGLTQIEMIT